MDGENAHSSDSAEGEELEKKDKTQKDTVFRKNTRLIELGWMHSEDGLEYHQVRAKNGGGTRRISVPISSKRNDLISTAAQLFFPKGVSSKGPLEEFALDLRDYGQNIMSDNSLTVGDVLKLTGFLKLRFYLSTQKVIDVDKISPATENQLLEKFDAGSSKDEFVEVFNENLIDEEHPEIDLLQFIDTESNSVIDRDILVVSPIAAVSTAINNENIRLTLHRGRIFEELINAFTILNKNCPYLVIEIIMPNGKPEVGVDVGGVFRDAISEFWATFYDTCTIGAKSKIPFVRHDYGTEQWKAVARILYKGYKDEKYFPLKLARPFIESCITGSSTSSLYDSFLKYVSESDGHTITQAIQNFDSVEEAELQEVFENLESRWVPSISNIEQLVRDIAHKEIIQKPKFIIDCWHDELKDLVIDLDDVYRATEPNSKNILALLAPELEELTSDARRYLDI